MKRLAMTLVALTLLMMTATAQTIKEGVYVIKSVSNPNYVLTLKNAQPGMVTHFLWKSGRTTMLRNGK